MCRKQLELKKSKIFGLGEFLKICVKNDHFWKNLKYLENGWSDRKNKGSFLLIVCVLHPNNRAVQQKADSCLNVIEALPGIAEKISHLPIQKYFMDCVEAKMVAKAFEVVNSAKSNHK